MEHRQSVLPALPWATGTAQGGAPGGSTGGEQILSTHSGCEGRCVLMGQWDVGGYSPFLWESGMAVQRHPLGLCSKG